ncbi:MAG: TerB family tellurite resistance protein [Beijerinckiaceae bacterium]
MFDALKNFIAEVGSGPAPERSFDEADYRLAAAALLIHVAAADGHVDEAERQRLQGIVEARFGLDPAAARRLIAAAEESEREAVDLYHFTATLKRALDESGRHQVVELMWDMAYADGEVHELEENIVWRVAELLGVPSRDRLQLKQRAEDTGGAVAASAPGPWAVAGGKS